MDNELVIVGVLARIDVSDAAGVRDRLNGMDGVETFDLPEPEKLGILIEAPGIDAAHQRLCRDVDPTEGVLGTWPVSLEFDQEQPDASAVQAGCQGSAD